MAQATELFVPLGTCLLRAATASLAAMAILQAAPSLGAPEEV